MITEYCQRDIRWASVAYAGETMGIAGCGPTSCACLTGELPTAVAEWMTKHGYASNQSGTYQSAIPAYLKHMGYNAEKITSSSLAGKTESLLFDTFRKSIESGNCGIILFGGKKTGCKDNYWCSGGHYCAVVGYSDGKYRIIDPYTPSHNGYHDWPDIAGDVKHLYTCSVSWKDAELDPQEAEDEMDYFKNFEIDKTYTDIGGVRTATKTIKVMIAPSSDSKQRDDFGWLGIGNKVQVWVKGKDTETNTEWALISAAGDLSKCGWIPCRNLKK